MLGIPRNTRLGLAAHQQDIRWVRPTKGSRVLTGKQQVIVASMCSFVSNGGTVSDNGDFLAELSRGLSIAEV